MKRQTLGVNENFINVNSNILGYYPAISLIDKDHQSGFKKINTGENFTIEENKQMTNWNKLEIDGTLIIDGELILR